MDAPGGQGEPSLWRAAFDASPALRAVA